jgi:hypothetical protein
MEFNSAAKAAVQLRGPVGPSLYKGTIGFPIVTSPMQAKSLIVALVTYLVTSYSFAADLTSQLEMQLTKGRPDVQWDMASAVFADFDGSGRKSGAMLGYKAKKVVLAIQTAADTKSGKIQYLELSVDRGVQAAICSAPARLEVYALECSSDGQPLPGCKAVPGSSGLSIVDGECDSIHLYWNQVLGHMQWWRR